MASVVGKWEFVEHEQMDELVAVFPEKKGLSDEMREKARQSQPKYEIERDNDYWIFRAIMGDFKRETKFKLGEPFQTSTIDGRTVTSTVTQDGEKLVENQDHPELCSTIVRWVEGDHLIMTITAKNVTAKVRYRRS
ncbi:fatty acid-binding protein type 2-like isoform X1 [Tubulanus polymorphus]|uniref:fatty acid-binding protein type 2-like isoform X1 n=1 Tax=Tubulanus polymorphus TaxID=672921 RepID=UPI003DA4C87D